MLQGRRMTRSHKGMRQGISLIEMLMAIVLLGVLSTVGFKYYKIYYDTTFAAKQAKVYVLIDQAQQLFGAHDLYETKNGVVPASIALMVDDRQLIAEPPVMPEIDDQNGGWQLKTYVSGATDGNITLSGTTVTENDIAFVIDINSSTSSNQDKLDYCNIVSNTGFSDWNLSAVDGTVVGNDAAAGYASALLNNDMYCYKSAATEYHMVFVKLVDPS